ncbi:actin-like [Acropora muricata]|uniref:actin-like n=1 Tax=Acropora muricata TaxID=159855 RepID=UPI0034E5B46B
MEEIWRYIFGTKLQLKGDQCPKLDKSYTLPGGRVITIGGTECIRCLESLFHPPSAKTGLTGIHQLVYSSVLQCDDGIQQELLANIVLAGGNTMFEGISQRIQKEVAGLAPSTIKTKVIAPPERKYSAWIGGSILASLSQFQSMWITKKDVVF